MKLTEILTGPETWCQRAMMRLSVEGTIAQVCLRGAIEMVVRELPLGSRHPRPDDELGPEEAARSLRYVRLLRTVLEDRGHEGGPIEFNDRHGRTFEEVLEVAAEADRRMALEEGGP